MNFQIDFFSISFVILIIHLTVVVPVTGFLGHKKLKHHIAPGTNTKLKEYQQIIIWSWATALLILLLILLPDVRIQDFGFRCITINTTLSNWIVRPFLVLCVVWFCYNVYMMVALMVSKKARDDVSKKIPDDVKTYLPVTKQEKKNWVYVALTAGTTEEIIYRSYLFFAFAKLFPTLSNLHILLISTFLFGIGHIYQGKEVIKPAILGLLFGFSYILFDSIIPAMVLHISQDLVVVNLVDEDEA